MTSCFGCVSCNVTSCFGCVSCNVTSCFGCVSCTVTSQFVNLSLSLTQQFNNSYFIRYLKEKLYSLLGPLSRRVKTCMDRLKNLRENLSGKVSSFDIFPIFLT